MKDMEIGDLIQQWGAIPGNVTAVREHAGNRLWLKRGQMWTEDGDTLRAVTPEWLTRHFALVVAEIERPAATIVYTLPEVDPRAVALVGVESGRRYKRRELGEDHGGAGGGVYWEKPGPIGEYARLGEVLYLEHPHGVTPEFAPPPPVSTVLDDVAELRGRHIVLGASAHTNRLLNRIEAWIRERS